MNRQIPLDNAVEREDDVAMQSITPKYELEDRVRFVDSCGEGSTGTVASVEVDNYGTAWYGVRWNDDDPEIELVTDCPEKNLKPE